MKVSVGSDTPALRPPFALCHTHASIWENYIFIFLIVYIDKNVLYISPKSFILTLETLFHLYKSHDILKNTAVGLSVGIIFLMM